ncbi:LysM domain-containing protein, partial [Kitasatospora purpeofusca]
MARIVAHRRRLRPAVFPPGRARSPGAVLRRAPAAPAGSVAPEKGFTGGGYVVKSGDTLSGIA